VYDSILEQGNHSAITALPSIITAASQDEDTHKEERQGKQCWIKKSAVYPLPSRAVSA